MDKAVASRSRRFWAFNIDQVILTIGMFTILVAVFATQQQQIAHLLDTVFADPLWAQTDQLSSAEFNSRYMALVNSDKVEAAAQALAYPFALCLTLWLLFNAAYYIVPTKLWGATPGKKLLHIVVHTVENGDLPGWERSTIRYFTFLGLGAFSTVVSILDLVANKSFTPSNPGVNALQVVLTQVAYLLMIIAVILIITRPDRRGLHDVLAKTIVHDSKAKKTPEH